ncbi:MAG: DNA cytosine methyltransferase [Rhizomicrobium sp.]
MILRREIRHAHIFCGLGGGAKGFNAGEARVGNMVAKFRCLGGIDSDAAALRDFRKLAGVGGTCLDLFSREQYIAFHGKEPPRSWRPAMPDDVRRAFGNERPHIVFLSAPCKGFSGLLSETTSKTAKYQALNGLTLRGVWLALEAYKDDPVELFIFENVPRIATRGRHLVDQIIALFRGYGYAVAETTHDCGELGGLAQSRKRFLLVARHEAKVPPYLYQPPKQRLHGIGSVLEKLPLPGPWNTLGGAMHRMPALQWKTWVRLAFVEAGSDWRSLNKLNVRDGQLADYGIAVDGLRNEAFNVKHWGDHANAVTSKFQPSSGATGVADPRIAERDRADTFGVKAWEQHTGVVAGKTAPSNGSYSVADPRLDLWSSNQAGVMSWGESSGVISGARSPLQGKFSVADPRIEGAGLHSAGLGVRPWDVHSGVVAGETWPTNGAFSVADPRPANGGMFNGVLRVTGFDEISRAVISGRQNGAAIVADPRPMRPANELHGKWHVTPFDDHSRAVISGRENGASVVADPRVDGHPKSVQLGVREWDQPAGTVTGQTAVGGGINAVSDPRILGRTPFNNIYRIVRFDQHTPAVAGGGGPVGGLAVADPRPTDRPDYKQTKYKVTSFDGAAGAVIGASTTGNGAFAVADIRYPWGEGTHANKMFVGAFGDSGKTVTGSDRVGSGAMSVADPRPEAFKAGREHYRTGGHYGVLGWPQTAYAVPGFAKNNNGWNSVADPRDFAAALFDPAGSSIKLPAANDRLVCVIRALDGTWHRPLTTLELAALQSLVDPEEFLELDGLSDSAWRERIGNAVPAKSAQAIASVMGRTLLLAWSGETFMLSAEPIWVRNVAIALSVAPQRGPWDGLLALDGAAA